MRESSGITDRVSSYDCYQYSLELAYLEAPAGSSRGKLLNQWNTMCVRDQKSKFGQYRGTF